MLPIDFLPAAERYLKKIKDKHLKKIYEDAIKLIRENPDAGQVKKGDLDGIYCYDVDYDNVNYEIAYTLGENQQGEVIVIIMAGSRENFYDALKKYMRGKQSYQVVHS
jgi:mRNA interferase RelE/StbE